MARACLDASRRSWGGRLTISVIVLTALAACADNVIEPPPGAPSVVRSAGPSATDSIDATPSVPLVVTVRDQLSAPVVGTSVVFTGENAQVAATGQSFGSTVTLPTDGSGGASVMVRFGGAVGAGAIIASVPSLGVADTLALTVRPGATVSIDISPLPSALTIGDDVALTATAVDRLGNPKSTGLSLSGPIELVGDGIRGTSLGVGTVVVSSEPIADTANVTVVPDGQVVFTNGSDAWVVRLDGTQPEQLTFQVPVAQEPSVSWDAAGERVVVGGTNGFRVFDVATEVTTPAAWPGGIAGENVIWPRFGPGESVYYSTYSGTGWDIRRTNQDGSAPEVVIADATYANDDHMPDWAPDESGFVFTADWEQNSQFLLRVSDPTATTISTIAIEGVTPVWSPDGSLIAYQELGLVGIVAPDESEQSDWSVGWAKGVTWSPGSDMLIGITESQRHIAILDVTTGVHVTLPHLGTGVDAVAWRPGSP